MRSFILVLVIFLVALVSLLSLFSDKPPFSQIFINATVLTIDANNSVAEAVAVQGDRIVAVGSNEDILRFRSENTIVHDLNGKTLVPGFIDAHGHFPGWGGEGLFVDLNSPPIGKIASIDQLVAKLKNAAKEIPSGEWLLGVGYDDSLLAENRHPTRWDLDTVSTERPIYILHISGHIGVANSFGLELAGIDNDTSAPYGGLIQRDPNGRINGVLEENARIAITELALDFSFFEFIDMIIAAAEHYSSVGVTTAQSGLTPEKLIQGLFLASKLGFVQQRLEVWPDRELGLRWVDGEFNPQTYGSKKFTIGSVKLVSDGSIQGFTGYLSQPYHTPHNGDSNYHGYPAIDQQTLNDTVSKLHQAGLQIAVHANGDAAIDLVINAVAAAQQQFAREDPRHIVIHSQMAREDQLIRMKEVGLTPSFFSAHTYYWGDRHRDVFMGPERAAMMSPTRSALDLGLPFTVHLDSPVVPMNPLFLLWSTVNRLSSTGKAIGPDQRISVQQALRATTIDAAWQIFQEDNRGSIEVGKYADLVVLSENPLENAERIKDLKVLQTVVGGVSIFGSK